jgi:hypothetical protein
MQYRHYHLATMISVTATFTCADPERAKLLEGVLALLSFFADAAEAPHLSTLPRTGMGIVCEQFVLAVDLLAEEMGLDFNRHDFLTRGTFRPAWPEQFRVVRG